MGALTAAAAPQRPHVRQQLAQQVWQQQLPQLQWQQQHRLLRPVMPQAGPPDHISTGGQKKRLAVFVSGGGSNFKAIHAACQKGIINAEVVVSADDPGVIRVAIESALCFLPVT